MDLSIIIPTYNAEKHINKCLNSILNQKPKNTEIIIVNDGSTDNTLEICKQYANTNPNIKIITKENAGQGLARNAGLEIATGEYITFIDSDDYFEDNCLNEVLKIIPKEKKDLYIGDYKRITENHQIIKLNKRTPKKYTKKHDYPAIINNQINTENKTSFGSTACGKFYKLKIIKENNIKFLSERIYFSEDMIFNLEYLKHINEVIILGKIIFNYVMHTTSFTHKYHDDYFNKLKKMDEYYHSLENYLTIKDFQKNISKKLFEYLKASIINEVKFCKNIGFKQTLTNINKFCNYHTIKQNIDEIINYSTGLNKIFAILIKKNMKVGTFIFFKLYLIIK